MVPIRAALLSAPLALALTTGSASAQHHGGGGMHMGGMHHAGGVGVGGYHHVGGVGMGNFHHVGGVGMGGYGSHHHHFGYSGIGYGGFGIGYGGIGYGGLGFGYGGLGYGTGLGYTGLGLGLGYNTFGYGYNSLGAGGLGYGGYSGYSGLGYYYNGSADSAGAYRPLSYAPSYYAPSTTSVSGYTPSVNAQPIQTVSAKPGPATLTVTIPAGAKVWFDGKLSDQKGTTHTFTTPTLEGGALKTVTVKMAIGENSPITMPLQLKAGDKTSVDLSGIH